jgi:RND family efflux transporter MFP subunit
LTNRLRDVLIVLTAATTTLSVVACGRSPVPAAAPAKPPAAIANATTEAALTTVTLSPEAEAHLEVKTQAVAAGPGAAFRTVGGEAVAPAGRAVTISAPVAGTLSAPSGRSTAIGSVRRNETLFELLPLQPSDRDARAEAERSLREAEARLAEAAQRLTRLEQLLKEGSASARSVEEARATHTVAAAAVDAAKTRVASMARVPVGAGGEIALVSPIDGVVTAVRAAPGQTVAAGAPVADVAQIATLWVRVPVFSGDLTTIDRTKPAAVTALGNEAAGPWREVTTVAGPPVADPAAASVDLYFELPNANGAVRPGERLAVRLSLRSTGPADAIVIPRSAVVYDINGGTWVYESRGSHVFARRRVEIADAGAAGVIVRRGLAAGTRIVTAGAAELYGTEFYVSK